MTLDQRLLTAGFANPREAGRYPKTYRLATLWIFVFGAFGATIVLCGILALRSALSQLIAPHGANPVEAFQLAAVSLPFTGMGVWFIIAPLLYTVVVSEDFIEERCTFRNKRFSRAAIAGKRVYPGVGMGRVRGVVIYPVDREILPMKIDMTIDEADSFLRWTKSIPNIVAAPSEWRAHLKYIRIVQYGMLAFCHGGPSIFLLASLAGRYLHL